MECYCVAIEHVNPRSGGIDPRLPESNDFPVGTIPLVVLARLQYVPGFVAVAFRVTRDCEFDRRGRLVFDVHLLETVAISIHSIPFPIERGRTFLGVTDGVASRRPVSKPLKTMRVPPDTWIPVLWFTSPGFSTTTIPPNTSCHD